MRYMPILIVSSLLIALGCSQETGTIQPVECGSGDTFCKQQQEPAFVVWSAVPAEFNPVVIAENFVTRGISRLEMNFHNFDEDIDIVYANLGRPDRGVIEAFTVSRSPRFSLSNIDLQSTDTTLSAYQFGNYECRIDVRNQQIRSLAGACYVRLKVTMPIGTEIEVYNNGRLVSPRFFPMSNIAFLNAFDEAFPASSKIAVIDSYLDSYRNLGKVPVLTSQDVDAILTGLAFSEPKLQALAKLHQYVRDKGKLARVLDDRFFGPDRTQAKEITGV